MTTVRDIQQQLESLGFDPGPIDGLIGPSTLRAMELALSRLRGEGAPSVVGPAIVPADWMPWADMKRIVFHWTAGRHKASELDRSHYHILIEGDGVLVQGVPIPNNDAPLKKGYAAHTLGLNSDSIGVSLCGMAKAQETPYNPGIAPINQQQWAVLADVLADLCRSYAIPVTRKTVLSHAEVEGTLGVKQRGKWDIARLPWDRDARSALAIGDQMRAMVLQKLER